MFFRNSIVWILFLFVKLSSIIYAQETPIVFKYYDNKDGLTSSSINCIVEDSLGFLWIGTQNGLNKFDGESFLTFKANPADSTGIPHPDISALVSDKKGLWIGTNGGGLVRYEHLTRRFHTITFRPNDKNWFFFNNSVRSVLTDSKHDLLVGTQNGLYRKNPLDKEFTNYSFNNRVNNDINDNTVSSIIEDKHGRIWIGSVSGLFRYEGGKYVKQDVSFQEKNGINITSMILSASHDGLWLGTTTGLYFMNFKTMKIEAIKKNNPLQGKYITSLFLSVNGNFWIGTINNGLYKYDQKTKWFVNHRLSDYHKVAPDNYIRTIYESRTGILWLGLYSNGLLKYDPAKSLFQSIPLIEPGESQIKNAIWGLYENNKKQLFIGSNSLGLIIYDRRNHTYLNVNEQLQKELKKSAVRSVVGDGEDQIWIGTDLSGVFAYNTRTRLFKQYPKGEKSISGNKIRALYRTPDGYVFVGFLNVGFSIIHPDGKTIENFVKTDSSDLPYYDIWDFEMQNDSLIWIATGDGLSRFNRKSKRFESFTGGPIRTFFSNTTIWYDGDSTLWLGTRYSGLARFNFISGEKKLLNTSNTGFSDNTIYTITNDKNNHLWFTTDYGIIEFDPKTLMNWNYSLEDGLLNLEFNSGSAYKNADGEIFFGGTNGVNMLQTHNHTHHSAASKLILKNVSIMGNSISGERTGVTIESLTHLTLLPDEKFVSFDFVRLGFSNTAAGKFSYKLQGYSDRWISIGSSKTVSFSRLDPGEYVFRFRDDNTENANRNEYMLVVTVKPYFWETIWFRLLVVIVIGLIIYVVVRYRIQRIRQINDLRWQIAADLHDELGGSLSGVALRTEILASSENTPEAVRKSLLGLVTNQRTLVENIDDIVWSVNPDNDRLGVLVEKIKDLCDSSFEGLSINHQIIEEIGNPGKRLALPYRKNLYLITKEIINNIVKHSDATIVTLKFLCKESALVIQISDNGKGFDQSLQKKGFGMDTLKKRADEINGKFTVQSEVGKGTKMTLEVNLV